MRDFPLPKQIGIGTIGIHSNFVCRGGEIGRRTGLKILGFRKGRTGSIPVLGTIHFFTVVKNIELR
jgi:hypothetical protein